MKRKGMAHGYVGQGDFMASIGLEIAMSLNEQNRIKDYWSNAMF